MDIYIEVYLCNKREQITATHNNMDGSHRQNAEQMKPTQKHMGPPRSRCRNGIRYARDLLGGKPVKNKGRGSRNRHGKPSDHNEGLKLGNGEEEGKTQ